MIVASSVMTNLLLVVIQATCFLSRWQESGQAGKSKLCEQKKQIQKERRG